MANMEIDTGSVVTILCKSDFDRISGDYDSLKPSRLILKGYSGGEIKCLGEKVMHVQIQNQARSAVSEWWTMRVHLC